MNRVTTNSHQASPFMFVVTALLRFLKQEPDESGQDELTPKGAPTAPC